MKGHDGEAPERGGTISMMLGGKEGHHMLDNLAINRRGEIFLQDDPGNLDYLAVIWRYTIETDTLARIAQHDPLRFQPINDDYYLGTMDEESSGIIDVSDILGEGWFLLDVQVPSVKDIPADDVAELVARGQLLALHVPPGRRE